jgi:glutaredoxin-dependent peroxiredoxin
MIAVGTDAPDFTAPLAAGDITEFRLSERLDEGPVVLAFFPGAFTSVCTGEMRTIQDRLAAFEAVDATVVGVSVDSPFALNAFRDQNDIEFGLISDANREIIADYDVTMDFEDLGLRDFAQRAVVIVDGDGEITYTWGGDPSDEPDYDELEAAAEAAS